MTVSIGLDRMLLATGPIWVPVVFLAYALGRRQFSLMFLFVAITTEAIALAVCWPRLWQ